MRYSLKKTLLTIILFVFYLYLRRLEKNLKLIKQEKFKSRGGIVDLDGKSRENEKNLQLKGLSWEANDEQQDMKSQAEIQNSDSSSQDPNLVTSNQQITFQNEIDDDEEEIFWKVDTANPEMEYDDLSTFQKSDGDGQDDASSEDEKIYEKLAKYLEETGDDPSILDDSEKIAELIEAGVLDLEANGEGNLDDDSDGIEDTGNGDEDYDEEENEDGDDGGEEDEYYEDDDDETNYQSLHLPIQKEENFFAQQKIEAKRKKFLEDNNLSDTSDNFKPDEMILQKLYDLNHACRKGAGFVGYPQDGISAEGPNFICQRRNSSFMNQATGGTR